MYSITGREDEASMEGMTNDDLKNLFFFRGLLLTLKYEFG